MNKLFNILLFTILSIVARAQDEKISHRVMLASDSIPIFGKNYSALHFGHSFFFTESKLANKPTATQLKNLISELNKIHSGISVFESTTGNDLVVVFTKESIRAFSDFEQLLNDKFTAVGIGQAIYFANKHIQVVDTYDVLDTNKGFN